MVELFEICLFGVGMGSAFLVAAGLCELWDMIKP